MLETGTVSNRVVAGMSGGIDSSAAALLLKRRGYDVVGISLKLWDYGEDAGSGKCCTPEDVRDARKVAFSINIPFYVRDYTAKFENDVVDYFTDAYLAGRTPNPCAVCNDKIKFSLLELLGRSVDAPYIGTGHYARLRRDPASGDTELLRGVDETRDQSYFLYRLKQPMLSKLLFPLGDMRKQEVRELLREARIGDPQKPESRELCFVENGRYSEFVAKRAAERLRPGKIVDDGGEVLGEHTGVHNFTVGQRKGHGVASPVPQQPYYVTGIDAGSGKVTLGEKQTVYKESCDVDNVSWTSDRLAATTDCEVQLRYRGTPVAARLEKTDNNRWRVAFKSGKELPSPGQAAVFYDGEKLLGGGWIL